MILWWWAPVFYHSNPRVGAFVHGCSKSARSVYCRDFSNKINLWIPKIVNCPPTPPLSQHFALSEKQVLMLIGLGEGLVGSFPETYIDPKRL